jgi:hypothetical protein
MGFLTFLLIFICVMFLYIHIIDQYKTSQDMEIYELDYKNNENLQETCGIRQPVIVRGCTFDPPVINTESNNHSLIIKDSRDMTIRDVEMDTIQLPVRSAIKLLNTDTHSHFFSESNHGDFVDESLRNQLSSTFDESLKPPFVTINSTYDFMTGSKDAVTPFRYHTEFRRFLAVASGKISVKMACWNARKQMPPILKDYAQYEFRTPLDVWSSSSSSSSPPSTLSFLEFDVFPQDILYIPPYWWFSIKYAEKNTHIYGITYTTLMNMFSNIHDLGRHWMQTYRRGGDVDTGSFLKRIDTERGSATDISGETERGRGIDMDGNGDKETETMEIGKLEIAEAEAEAEADAEAKQNSLNMTMI